MVWAQSKCVCVCFFLGGGVQEEFISIADCCWSTFFYPSRRRCRQTADVRFLLESKGASGYLVCTASLSLGWIPLDTDLVTLNLPRLYADYFLHGDCTWPHVMGLELGQLLEQTSASDLAPFGCRVGDVDSVESLGVRGRLRR